MARILKRQNPLSPLERKDLYVEKDCLVATLGCQGTHLALGAAEGPHSP